LSERDILRDHLTELLAESMHLIRNQRLLTVRSLALLPNDKDNLSDFYQPLRTRLIREFQEEDLVPLKRGGHAAATYTVRGGKALSELIDDEGLAKVLHEREIPPEWAANPAQRNQREDNFLSMLEIEEWTEDDLVTALSEMDDSDRSKWMISKEDAWHQALYALLHENADELADVQIVKTSDGKYRAGNECFFPTEDTEHDDKFPRVARATYSSRKGKEQQKRARSFLEDVGVREVDENVEIEALLKRYYGKDTERPNRKEHYSHLRRFIRFIDRHPDARGLFQNAYLLMADVANEVIWVTPEYLYLDTPYMKTGLHLYYEVLEERVEKYPLARAYRGKSAGLGQIAGFAERLGAATELEIIACRVPRTHPEWKSLSRHGGFRWTRGTDEDYHIPCLTDFLKRPSIEKSKLLWRTMSEFCEDSWCEYLKARFPL